MEATIIMPAPLGPGGKPRQVDPKAKHAEDNASMLVLYRDDPKSKVATVVAIPSKKAAKDGSLQIGVSIPPEHTGNEWGLPISMDKVNVATHFLSGNGNLITGVLKVGDKVLCTVEKILDPTPDPYEGKYLTEPRVRGKSYVLVLKVVAKIPDM